MDITEVITFRNVREIKESVRLMIVLHKNVLETAKIFFHSKFCYIIWQSDCVIFETWNSTPVNCF